MFHNHNGHELSQLTEIYSNVTGNIDALGVELANMKKRMTMSQEYLEKVSRQCNIPAVHRNHQQDEGQTNQDHPGRVPKNHRGR